MPLSGDEPDERGGEVRPHITSTNRERDGMGGIQQQREGSGAVGPAAVRGQWMQTHERRWCRKYTATTEDQCILSMQGRGGGGCEVGRWRSVAGVDDPHGRQRFLISPVLSCLLLLACCCCPPAEPPEPSSHQSASLSSSCELQAPTALCSVPSFTE